MEAFSITCTTCKSRLKVKSLAAVGQLVKCPKCGGMVLVKAPHELSPEEAAAQKAQTEPAIQRPVKAADRRPDEQDTIGENRDFEDIEALLATSVPKTAPPPARKSATGGALAASEVRSHAHSSGSHILSDSRHSQSVTGNGKPAAGSAAAKEAPPVPGSEVQPLPSGQWASASRHRYWLFLAASVLAGIGLAFSVVALSLSFFDDKGDKNVAVVPTVPTAKSSSTGKGTPESSAKPSSSDAARPGPPVPVEDKTKSANSTTKSPSETKPPETNPGTTTEPTKTSETKIDDDPLKLTRPKEETKPAPPAPAGSDPFGKLTDLLGRPDEDPTRVKESPAEAAKPGPMPEVPAADSRPSLPRPPIRTINLAARMNDPIPGIDVAGAPLADVLQFLQDFSTIPITLEPDALAFHNLSPETPVSLRLENASFGTVLQQVATEKFLEIVTEEDQIVIRVPELAKDKMGEPKLRLFNHAVGDLTHNDEKQAAVLAEHVMSLIEPGAWGDDEDEKVPSLAFGKDAFAVRQRKSALVKFLALCQKLRVARGLPPAEFKDMDPSLFTLETRAQKAEAKLAAPVSVTFNRPTPFVKILQRLSAAGKVRILVDWRSIAAAGWNPDGEATLVVDKKPLGEALLSLLAPMDLAYRIVDGKTLQVVAPQTLAQRLEIEIYPVREFTVGATGSEALLARVRGALADGGDGELAGHLWLDAESKCLVASLSQPKHQLLARSLLEWRKDEAR